MDHSTFISGIKYPNRVFVGGLPREAVASDLADFFTRFGQVTESKVILNEDGTSKGYGFVTFASSEDVKCVFGQGVIFYKKKKLNLGPAIRKQAPETPGEPILFVRTTPSNQQPPPQPAQPHPPAQLQMPAARMQISPPSPHLPPSPTQLAPARGHMTASPPEQQLVQKMPFQGAIQQHCYQSMPFVPTYPEVCYRPSFPWYQATA